ncbi:MAG: TonB-dependent siderophore receptor, partial [Gemmatimonadetes bacterium]
MVTVYRSPAAIGRVPYPISVVGPAALQRGTTGTSLEEVLRAVPGLQVQNRFNPAVGERLAMRGFGARAQFGVRGLKVLVDGIPATLPDGQATLDHIDPGALGRVEVVRGPASALYGNAAGGVITFETAPAPGGTAAQGGVVAGAYGTRRWEAGASFGSSASGVRLNVARTTSDGFRADPDRPAERYGSSERTVLSGRAEHRLLGGDLVWSLNVLDLGAENPGAVDR